MSPTSTALWENAGMAKYMSSPSVNTCGAKSYNQNEISYYSKTGSVLTICYIPNDVDL